MNNYEYIVASLPTLQPVRTKSAHAGAEQIVQSIREQLSEKDNGLVDLLLSGYESDNLDAGFYHEALHHRNRFIREFFEYDLNLRNIKVEYLNRSLGRPEGMDTVSPEGWDGSAFDGRQEIMAVLEGDDILKRERGLDDLMWRKIDEITVMDVFDMEAILGFIAKLKIIDRWDKLDPDTGHDLFRRLVEEIRATYDNKKNNMI
ncbi:MAG TPA: DUF2764 family protein [Candidatus Cryptobacteroides merdipullorum]|uniref:DUF2764 family protein n=1 Tax=Candidatus Cryptobacteroides merdipullorum TaxID=2840771 RepID=A0A9D1GMX8_9BACT|nr:DUF2764 family protein [Candidatus Cryptobacteroides merdipullorum]